MKTKLEGEVKRRLIESFKCSERSTSVWPHWESSDIIFFMSYNTGNRISVDSLGQFVLWRQIHREEEGGQMKFGMWNLQPVSGSHVDLAALPSWREGRGLTVLGAGRAVGRRQRRWAQGKHCENVTATLTAGQFSKRDAAGHFPLCIGTKSWGGGSGGGSRLRTQRDVTIK